jgi:alkaline phosphatase D
MFRHGVASGDPLDDRVILWTRVSGATSRPIRVNWEIASDPDMQRVVRRGEVWATDEHDYTVKVDARRLRAGRTYYYRFAVYGAVSETGRTRTLPKGRVSSARFAVVSCSNHPYGYFHAYREIAAQQDLDAVIHLGDYIYEYGLGEYATERAEALGRIPEPATELRTLADYRLRHAQYKADPDSRAMHAQHPLIAVWDDHEVVNDTWKGGALDHNEADGDFTERVTAAVRAYFEWMPIRGEANGGETAIFRSFRYGNLISLIMLDTRLYGRDRQPDVPAGAEEVTPESVAASMNDPDRTLLGARQQKWFQKQLKRSRTVWQLVGQQVLVAPFYSPDLEPLVDLEGDYMISRELLEHSIAISKSNPPAFLDTWNGYPFARAQFLEDLRRKAKNPVVISGDLHTAMGNELIPEGATEAVAVEFMPPSVTSPGFTDYLPERQPGAIRDAAMELNPWVKYMDTERKGWMCLSFDRSECTAEWHLLDTVHEQEYSAKIDKRLTVRAGKIAAAGLV